MLFCLESYSGCLDQVIKTFGLKLLEILCYCWSNLCSVYFWILGVASQKLRANLYSSLLSFMHIVCLPEKSRSEDLGLNMTLPDPSISLGSVTSASFSATGSPLRQERKTPLQASLDLVLGFGEGVVDVMCHDGTGGLEICKVITIYVQSLLFFLYLFFNSNFTLIIVVS